MPTFNQSEFVKVRNLFSKLLKNFEEYKVTFFFDIELTDYKENNSFSDFIYSAESIYKEACELENSLYVIVSKVNISTPENKADYNKMYNEIQLIISFIIDSFKVVVELYKLSGLNESDFNWLLNNELYQKVYK